MVKPAPRDDVELLAWAASIVQREQKGETYGRVVIRMEKGRIVGVTIEKNELPTFTNPSG